MRTQMNFVSRTRDNGKVAAVQHLDYHSFFKLKQLASDSALPLDTGSWFACSLAIHFPEMAATIDEDDFDVLHLEVGRLKLASRGAILSRDWERLSSHYAFVAAISDNASPELQDAIDVSYLGCLLHDEASINFAKARTLLPRRLLARLEAIERHYASLMQ